MQIIYTLEKVTKRRIENLIFILIAAVLSLVLILFFCSFSNRLDQGLIGIADLVTCVLSIGLIWTVVAVFVTMFNRIKGGGKESLSTVIYLYRLSKDICKMFKSYVGIINKYFIKGKPIEDHRVKAFVVDNDMINPLEPELWNKNAAKYFTERIQ